MQKIGKLSKGYYIACLILILISSFISMVLTGSIINYLAKQTPIIELWNSSMPLLLLFAVVHFSDKINLAQARQILKKNNFKKITDLSPSFFIKDAVIYQIIIVDSYVYVIPQKISKEELLKQFPDTE